MPKTFRLSWPLAALPRQRGSVPRPSRALGGCWEPSIGLAAAISSLRFRRHHSEQAGTFRRSRLPSRNLVAEDLPPLLASSRHRSGCGSVLRPRGAFSGQGPHPICCATAAVWQRVTEFRLRQRQRSPTILQRETAASDLLCRGIVRRRAQKSAPSAHVGSDSCPPRDPSSRALCRLFAGLRLRQPYDLFRLHSPRASSLSQHSAMTSSSSAGGKLHQRLVAAWQAATIRLGPHRGRPL